MKKLSLIVCSVLLSLSCKAASYQFASPTLVTNAVNSAISNIVLNFNLYVATNNFSVSNSTVETTIIPTGVGTLSVAANYFIVGRTLKVQAQGVYISTNGNMNLNLKLLGSTIAITTITNLNAGVEANWSADLTITCRETGASGKIIITGNYLFDTARYNFISIPGTFDTTSSRTLDLTTTWGFATLSNAITTKSFISQPYK